MLAVDAVRAVAGRLLARAHKCRARLRGERWLPRCEVAIASMRSLTRNPERLSDRREGLALAQRAADLLALERVKFLAKCRQGAQSHGSFGCRNGTFQQRKGSLCIEWGHNLVNARWQKRSGRTRPIASSGVEDPCDVTAVATHIRLKRAA